MQNLGIDCNIKASILFCNAKNKRSVFSTWKDHNLHPQKLKDHARGEIYVFHDKTVIRIGGSHEFTIRAFSIEKSKSIVRLFSKFN